MRKLTSKLSLGVALVALLSLASCNKKPAASGESMPHSGDSHTKAAGKELYQCAMHPNVVSEKPGKCPICGMDLQLVKQIKAKGIPGRGPVQLTDQQVQLVNIRTAPVSKEPLGQTIRAVGQVVVNEEKTAALNSRVMGWVEKLYVDTTGAAVTKGQPLMALYSPDLYSAQQDYLIARRQGGSLVESARKRLELFGISDEQIAELEKTGKATNTLDITAPLAGTVIEKKVLPSQMVQPGMPLYRIADLSEVWVQAELYESELPFVQKDQKAIVTIPAYPGREWEGRVDFIYPFLEGKTRTNMVRVVLANPEGQLKPEMYVNVQIKNDLGDTLSVPASAVFNTGQQQYLFVEQDKGVFVPTLVELGPRVGENQVIRGGVKAGDAVVVDGNFLLDSESQLKAAASGPVEEPSQEMAAMDLTMKHPLPKEAAPAVQQLVASYEKVRALLARDTIEGIAEPAEQMKQALAQLRAPEATPKEAMDAYAEKLSALEKCVAVLPPPDLESARKQFGAISAALIDLFKSFPPPLEAPLQVVHCPMWKKSPADWLQSGKALENPFLGQQMPTCGNVVSTITGAR